MCEEVSVNNSAYDKETVHERDLHRVRAEILWLKWVCEEFGVSMTSFLKVLTLFEGTLENVNVLFEDTNTVVPSNITDLFLQHC